MKTIHTFLLSGLISGISLQVDATVKIVECGDGTGGRSFYQEKCPAGTVLIDSRQIVTKKVKTKDTDSTTIEKVVLYTVPECESCEQVKEFLQVKKIPFTEKDIANDAKLQDELKAITGELRVPVTVIGDKIINGYRRYQMREALNL